MELLLPYANDINGKLIHISNSQKGQKYTCPNCGAELSLKIGRVRRAHFAHKIKTDDENRCSESILHKHFKEKCSELINATIKEKQELFFSWKCIRCRQPQIDNLLSDVVEVATEYNLGVCRPDIALLDSEGKVIKVVEIVVSHSPEEKSLKYYKENNIVCLRVKVTNFEECDEIEKVLKNIESVEIYPEKECEKCNLANKNVQRGDCGINRTTSPLSKNKQNSRQLIEIPSEKVCSRCGGKMQLKKTMMGSDIFKCECGYILNVLDSILWPDIFK